jgi:hypothetical protein
MQAPAACGGAFGILLVRSLSDQKGEAFCGALPFTPVLLRVVTLIGLCGGEDAANKSGKT